MSLRRTLETRQPALESIAVWAFSRLLLWLLVGRHGSDVPFYRDVAERVAAGGVAYVDFTIDHPPLALMLIRLPEALRSWVGYDTAFRAMMLAVDLGIMLLLLRLASRAGDGAALEVRVLRLYTWLGALAFPLLYDRVDLALAAGVLLLAWCGIRGWSVRAWIILLALPWLNAGAVVLGPFWLLVERFLEGRWPRALARFAAWAAATFVLVALAPAILGPGAVSFLLYHWRGPVEIQSVAAIPPLLAHLAGLSQQVDVSTGALRLSGPLARAVSASGLALTIAAVAALWALIARSAPARPVEAGGRRRMDIVIGGTITGVMASLIVSQTLLPQYVLWAAPLACLAVAVVRNRRGWAALWSAAVLGSVLGAPLHPEALMRLEPEYVALLIGRNLAFVVLTAWSVSMTLPPGAWRGMRRPAAPAGVEAGLDRGP